MKKVTIAGMSFDPSSAKETVAVLRRMKKALAKNRDNLRAVHDEIEDVLDSADQGIGELENAIDTLSSLV